MTIQIFGRGVQVTDDFMPLCEKKLARFDKYFRVPAKATVILKKTKIKEIVELTISVENVIMRSENEAETFRTALDGCISCIERQIRKNKTKLERRFRDDTLVAAEAFRDIPDAEDEAEEKEFVIHTKKFVLKPMSVEEAILQMNLLGHDFFVYKDAETGKNNVVYKRNDGEYGCIVDET